MNGEGEMVRVGGRFLERTGYRLRFAEGRDTERLAGLHLKAGQYQPGAFFPRLGVRFLRRYYDMLISEGDQLVLCAVTADDQIVGFVSATRRAEDHFANLTKQKARLFFSLSLRAILSPRIVLGLWNRSRSLSESPGILRYVVPNGCRIEYWAWDPDQESPPSSVLLMTAFLEVARSRGIKSVRLEVDAPNRHVFITHQMLGAKVVVRFRTPDGRERAILEHLL